MIGSLAFVLAIQTKTQKSNRSPDYNNAQLSIRYIREEPYGGTPRYGNDTTPYLITQTFEPYKGPPTFDPGDTPPLTFTLEKPGKGGWKFTDKSDSPTMEVTADANVAIPYQRWDFRGFTVLDAKTGAKLWTRKPAGKGNRACVALIDGTLYQWDAGHLTATNPQTGNIIWNQNLAGTSKEIEIPPMLVKNGKLFIELDVHGKVILYCLNASTGAQIWSKPIGPELSPFVVTAQRIIAYEYSSSRGTDNNKVSMVCLNSSSGEKLWSMTVDISSTLYGPQATDDVVFMPGCRSPSYLYKMSDGSLIKKFDMRVNKQLFGHYLLEIDDTYGLVISLSDTGERIGRIQLAKGELWEFESVQDRLLINSPQITKYPNTVLVYEITANR